MTEQRREAFRRQLAEHVESWQRVALDPLGPTDRTVAAEAIRDIYEGAGFGRPPVLFCSSPEALQLTAELIDMRARTRENRRPRFRRFRIARARLAAVRDAARQLPREQWGDIVGNVRKAPVKTGFEIFWGSAHWWRRWNTLHDFDRIDRDRSRSHAQEILRLASQQGKGFNPLEAVFEASDGLRRHLDAFGRFDCARLARYTFLRDVFRGELADLAEKAGGPNLAAQEALARAAGSALFFRNLVLVADRHIAARFDAEGRIHSESGPAIVYPDARGVYAIHGVIVPRGVIEHPVTLEQIEVESNVELRRILIDRYGGLERYLGDAGAEEVARDSWGVLLKRWYNRGHRAALTVVRVANSTPELDGSRREYLLQVRPGCKTPREAIASTFGLRAHEYSPAVET